jgi:hypothetical protein
MRFKYRPRWLAALLAASALVVSLVACDGATGSSNTAGSGGGGSCGTLNLRKAAVRSAKKAGFSESGQVKALQVACAESGLSASARLVNTNGTVDRGWMQFNNKSHKEVSNKCAANLDCSMKQAYRVTKGGKNWGEWCTTGRSSCGGHGKDRISQFKTQAKAAVAAVKAESKAKPKKK